MTARSLLALILLVSLFAAAQESQLSSTPPSARPTIGLVLEGGGALGLAHVGVLRWFEQHRIPVDYVAGTSMGGVVGGLYATGESGQEIQEFVHGINWNVMLRGDTPYPDLSFRRKEDAREYPNSLEFGLKHGVQFPSGFNSGQQVGLLLDQISLPYSDMQTFDDLPTPFRCVATDLVTGKPHVFESGSLSQALRATMSLPGIFTPVRSDGQVYVDGGLLENLPVDVARRMGAEIVIAVHLQTQAFSPDQPLSSFGVLNRSISVVIARNELRSMETADLLINVDLEKYSSTQYEEAQAIEQLGYDAAEEKSRVLSRFSLDESSWQQYLETRKSRRRSVPVPSFVEVTGAAPLSARGIEKALAEDVGRPVDPKKLDQQLTLVTGVGRFDRAGYSMVRRGDQDGLLIHADEKSYAPPTVNPLLVIDGSDYNNVGFAAGARITLFDIGGYGSEWRNDIILGSEYGISTEYYHPLRWASHWFVAPNGFANSAPYNLYLDNHRQAQYRGRAAGGGLDFGIAINRDSEFRVGYEAYYSRLNLEIGSPTLPSLSGRVGVTTAKYRLDRSDNAIVPRQGLRLASQVQWYDAKPAATENFPLVETRTGIFQRISAPSSVFLLASGGTTFGYNNTGVPLFSLGGPLRLSAYGTNEFLTNQYYLFQPGYIRRLKQLSPLLGDNVYFISYAEVAKVFGVPSSSVPFDGSAAILVETFFGPVTLGGSIGNAGHHKVFFQVGRVF